MKRTPANRPITDFFSKKSGSRAENSSLDENDEEEETIYAAQDM